MTSCFRKRMFTGPHTGLASGRTSQRVSSPVGGSAEYAKPLAVAWSCLDGICLKEARQAHIGGPISDNPGFMTCFNLLTGLIVIVLFLGTKARNWCYFPQSYFWASGSGQITGSVQVWTQGTFIGFSHKTENWCWNICSFHGNWRGFEVAYCCPSVCLCSGDLLTKFDLQPHL